MLKRFRLFSLLAAAALLWAAAPAVAQLNIVDLGEPIAPHGFPSYYEDSTGLKLEPCLPDPAGFSTRPELCVFDPLDPESDIKVAGEIFWWIATATIDPLPTGGRAVLTLAVEGTFGGNEEAVDGQQIAFGRTRIRVETPVAGTYTVTYPYGTRVFEVSDPAEGINFTADIGASDFRNPAQGFRGTLFAPMGPFLTWPNYGTNPDLQVLGPGGVVLEQYVGDPRVNVPVVGSPTGNNFFRVTGPEGFFAETDLFSVSGKVFDPTQDRTAHVFPEAPFPKLYAMGLINRVAPFAEPTTARVTGVDVADYPVGYPLWFQERVGPFDEPVGGLKLMLCEPGTQASPNPMCISDTILAPGEVELDEDGAVVRVGTPEMSILRTGGEGFYWSADATIENGADDFDLILGLEATFGGDESIIDGNQITFGRERIRIDTTVSGAGTYRITHPYAVRIFEDVPARKRGIDWTSDLGSNNPEDPDGAHIGTIYSDIGPQVLKWTTFHEDPEHTDPRLRFPDNRFPSGWRTHVGDPGVAMTVTGSPLGINYFRVEKWNGSDWDFLGETDLFFVSGQVWPFPSPVAVDDQATALRTIPSVIEVLANDTYAGEPVNPAAARVFVESQPANGTAVANPDGTITYTANLGFWGIDSFTYTAIVGLELSNVATVTVEVFAPVEAVTLVADAASPQAAGVPVTFTAEASGGSGNYEYRFWLKTGPTWAVVQPYSGSAQYLWDTTGLPNGTYFVQVDARNAGDTVVRDVARVVSFSINNDPPITAVNLTADPPSPQAAGTPVTFTASHTGGGDSVEYRFWVRTGGIWSVVQNYGASNTFAWNTAGLENGTYYIQVDARAAGTGVAREAAKVLAYAINDTPPITALALVADPASPQVVGVPSVTFTATPTGGGGNIEYRFWLKTGATWAVVQNYGASNTWAWPTAAVAVGTYFVQVDARNADSVNARDIAKVLRYDIVAPPPAPATGVSLISDLPSPQVAGTAVTFTAAGQGGSGDYEYRFWLKTGPTWAIVQNYGAADTWEWMTGAAAPGTYFVQVDVRSAGSTANRDAARVVSFVIE